MQCRTCGEHGKEGLSSMDPEQASLVPQLVACSSFVCHDCVVQIQHWRHFLTRFQTSQTLFQQVLAISNQQSESPRQTAVGPSLESILPKCRVLVTRLLECDSCSFYSETKTDLATHMQTHQAPNTSDGGMRRRPSAANVVRKLKSQLHCVHCNKYFAHTETFTWHKENCHGPDAIINTIKISYKKFRYQCAFCKNEFETITIIMQHLQTNHRLGNMPFVCNVCGNKSYISNHERNLHQQNCKKNKIVNSTSEKKRIKCKMCNAAFKSESILRDHISKFHAVISVSQSYDCLYCEESFKFFSYLKLHCNSKHPEKHLILRCEICKTHFASHPGYMLHKKEKHGDQRQIWTCDICKKMFTSKASYMQHKNYKHGSRAFTCNICSVSFSYPCNLKRHKKTVHSQLNRVLYCKLCNAKIQIFGIFKCTHS